MKCDLWGRREKEEGAFFSLLSPLFQRGGGKTKRAFYPLCALSLSLTLLIQQVVATRKKAFFNLAKLETISAIHAHPIAHIEFHHQMGWCKHHFAPENYSARTHARDKEIP